MEYYVMIISICCSIQCLFSFAMIVFRMIEYKGIKLRDSQIDAFNETIASISKDRSLIQERYITSNAINRELIKEIKALKEKPTP